MWGHRVADRLQICSALVLIFLEPIQAPCYRTKQVHRFVASSRSRAQSAFSVRVQFGNPVTKRCVSWPRRTSPPIPDLPCRGNHIAIHPDVRVCTSSSQPGYARAGAASPPSLLRRPFSQSPRFPRLRAPPPVRTSSKACASACRRSSGG